MAEAKRKIVLIEDEPALADNYREALTTAGYQVSHYRDRPAAEKALVAALPDLVIVDIGLGSEYEGGFVLCQHLRSRSATLPILILSARDSDIDVVSGLRIGADDYLTKDISLAQLLARVAALFRRVEALAQPRRTKGCGRLQIDEDRLSVRWNDQAVALTVTEFWLVHALARYPGQVRSRSQLMDAAKLVLDDQTVTAHIKRIRRKFQAVDADFEAIRSVYAAGYRWVDDAS